MAKLKAFPYSVSLLRSRIDAEQALLGADRILEGFLERARAEAGLEGDDGGGETHDVEWVVVRDWAGAVCVEASTARRFKSSMSSFGIGLASVPPRIALKEGGDEGLAQGQVCRGRWRH